MRSLETAPLPDRRWTRLLATVLADQPPETIAALQAAGVAAGALLAPVSGIPDNSIRAHSLPQ